MSVSLWKNIGQTPWDVVEAYRKEHGIDKSVKICYTGRLDPMAQGVLPILIGDECKKMDDHLARDKTYSAEAVLGISTDTYDPMGLITNTEELTAERIDKFKEQLLALSGKTFKQYFPPYSAYLLRKGATKAPLWWWAMNDRLDEIKDLMPSKDVTVYSCEITDQRTVSLVDYVKTITDEIRLVKEGTNFRQDEIIVKWNEFLKAQSEMTLTVISFTAKVSTGTYIRSLVNDIGIPTHAHLITRTEYHS